MWDDLGDTADVCAMAAVDGLIASCGDPAAAG